MKIITFLLLIIAVNCNGQVKDTTPINFKDLATFRIEALPTYMGVIGSNFLVLHDARRDSSAQLWYIERVRWGSEKIAWMNADGSIVIKDTMATIIELLKHISLREHEVTKLYDLQDKLYDQIMNIYRKNYVVDKKKFDKVVSGHK